MGLEHSIKPDFLQAILSLIILCIAQGAKNTALKTPLSK